MVARTAATPNPLESLARRVTNPKPVSLATLHKRHQEACRLTQTIRTTLALLDVSADGAAWGRIYRLVMRAEEVSTLAYRRWQAAFDEAMAERYEAQQLGEALMTERWLAYETAGSGEVDAALAWVGE
jgi:uncharacterized protein YqiB (DUF1249 family)